MNHTKTTVLIFTIAVAVLIGILAINPTISGSATYEEITTEFSIDAWGYKGWGECKDQQGSWEQINAYCISEGYAGTAPDSEKPCYHSDSAKRWGWDGKAPMNKGASTGSGRALTKVKCVAGCFDEGDDFSVKEVCRDTEGKHEDFCGANTPVVNQYGCKNSKCQLASNRNCASDGEICADGACVRKCESPAWLDACKSNCGALPVPIFKVCPNTNPSCTPDSESYIEVYLDNVPLTTSLISLNIVTYDPATNKYAYQNSDYTLSLVDDAGTISGSKGRRNVDGSYRIKVLMDSTLPENVGVRFGNFDEFLLPSQTKIVKYTSSRKLDKLSVFLYKKSSGLTTASMNANDVHTLISKIGGNLEQVTDRHKNICLYVMPRPLTTGSSGNFYNTAEKIMGLNIGAEASDSDIISAVEHEFSHEYGHALEPMCDTYFDSEYCYYSSSCFSEGLVDSLSVHLGYNKTSILSTDGVSGESTEREDCTELQQGHNLGRCIFKHLYMAGLFSDTFFKRLYNPTEKYINLGCGESIFSLEPDNVFEWSRRKSTENWVKVMSYAAGRDVTDILRDKVGMKLADHTKTDFPVDAWGYKGWGDCSQQFGTRAQLTEFCKSKGRSNLASGDACYHEWTTDKRYQWDGTIPMTKGELTWAGIALTKVKCI